jgi:transposase
MDGLATARPRGNGGHFTREERESQQAVARLRRASGATYREIAEELGVSAITARAWTLHVPVPAMPSIADRVRGAYAPGMTVRQVADAVGVSNVSYVRKIMKDNDMPIASGSRVMTRDQVELRRRALEILRSHGFNDEDVAVTLGISRQRASQLRSQAGGGTDGTDGTDTEGEVINEF